MNLLVYDLTTGVILSEGVVFDEYALPPEKLPPGSAYVDKFPEGPMDAWRYRDGQFVPVLQGGEGS